MTKEKRDRQTELLEQVLETIQNLFILQALEAGVTSEDVRKFMRIDKDRVSRVSKIRKKRE
jgi:hypothetical protein